MNIAKVTDCERRIHSCYDQLSAAERKVADAVLKDISGVLNSSIAELAYASQVSEPTVVRFCHSIGYRGLKDLKLFIAKSATEEFPGAGAAKSADISSADNIADIKHKVTRGIFESVQNTMDILDNDDLQAAIDILCSSTYIEIFGVGGSAMIARSAHHSFRKLGLRITLCTDLQSNYFLAEQYAPEDVIVAISNSGETESILSAVKHAKSFGAKVIAITGVDNSRLKQVADINLSAMSRMNIFSNDHPYVRLGQLSIINLLYAGIGVKKHYEGQ